jgi:hypothetical protein
MGDPAEENDPPPESQAFLTKGMGSVNWKKKQKYEPMRTMSDWGVGVSG